MKVLAGLTILSLIASTATAQLPHPYGLGAIDPANGVFISIPEVGDNFNNLDTIGDINADGVVDFAFGNYNGEGPSNDLSYSGEVSVVYGRAGGLPESLSLPATSPNGFTIYGVDQQYTGVGNAVGGGDFNGDGIADLLVGNSRKDLPATGDDDNTGALFLFFGKPGGLPDQFTSALETTSGNTGNLGFITYGRQSGDWLGRGAIMQDVNGDGLADIVAAAIFADTASGTRADAGEIYVIFGTPANLGPGFDLNSLNGANGSVLSGPVASESVGYIRPAGDVNGDGYKDFLIINPVGDGPGNSRSNCAEIYLVYGRPSWPANLDLLSLFSGDGSDGTVIYGAESSSSLEARGVGDLNGDGIGDLVISNVNSGEYPYNYRGNAWIIYGRAGGLGASRDLASAADYNEIIWGFDPADSLGTSIAGGFDINGDGRADCAVSSPGRDLPAGINYNYNTGETYCIYGSALGPPAGAAIGSIDGDNGLYFRGTGNNQGTGGSLGGGDFNADGISDFLISSSGGYYVIYGKRDEALPSASSTLFASPGDGEEGDEVPPLDFGETIRLVVDFSDEDLGAGPDDAPSQVDATVYFDNSGLTGITNPGNSYWELTTDRENWDSADLTFTWVEGDVPGGKSLTADVTLYQSTAGTEGPWQEVPSTVDSETKKVTATVTEFGHFALSFANGQPAGGEMWVVE